MIEIIFFFLYFNKKKNIFMTRTVEILLADWGVNIGVEIEIEKENICENEMKCVRERWK